MPFGLSLGKGILYLVLVLAIVALLWRIHAKIYDSGYEAGYAKLTEYKGNQLERTIEVIREVEKVVVEVQEKIVYRDKIIKEKGNVIVARVPIYITKADDSACELRNGFVRLHDSAARNQSAEPASDTDRDPSGITLSQATTILAQNYTLYHSCREKVIGWNEFWVKYRETLKGAVCLARED